MAPITARVFLDRTAVVLARNLWTRLGRENSIVRPKATELGCESLVGYQGGLSVAGRAAQARLPDGPEKGVGAELVSAWASLVRRKPPRRNAEVSARRIPAEIRLETVKRLRDDILKLALRVLCQFDIAARPSAAPKGRGT